MLIAFVFENSQRPQPEQESVDCDVLRFLTFPQRDDGLMDNLTVDYLRPGNMKRGEEVSG